MPATKSVTVSPLASISDAPRAARYGTTVDAVIRSGIGSRVRREGPRVSVSVPCHAMFSPPLGESSERRNRNHPWKNGQRPTPYSSLPARAINPGDASLTSGGSVDLSGADEERPHRTVQPSGSTCQSVHTRANPTLPALYVQAYLPDALGAVYGPLDARLPRGTPRFGWAQFWEQSDFEHAGTILKSGCK